LRHKVAAVYPIAIALGASLNLLGAGTAYSDIEYAHPGGVSLRLDGYVPGVRDAAPFPAVVIVHGGAWVAGDRKRSVEPILQPLTDAGFAWFSISYRLANSLDPKSLPSLVMGSSAALSGAINDVRSAVAFVRAHAAEYNIDPNRIALIGESAGAQLASVAALKPGENGAVQAAVAFYSPSDLVTLIRNMPMIPDQIKQMIIGTPLEEMLFARLRELSPLTYVRADAPPFLLIHGTGDPVVPYTQSVDMCSALKKAGAICDVITVDGAGHGMKGWELRESMTAYKPEMIRWLSSKLSPKP
jgi:alpha-L-fucosidase 2